MNTERLSKIIGVMILVLGVCMVLYHLVFTRTLLQGPIEHQNTHLMFALLLIFLSSLKKKPKLWPLLLPLILLSLVGTGYVQIFYEKLEEQIIRSKIDIAMGIVILVVCVEAARQAFGLVLPLVAIIFVAYSFLGQYLPTTNPFWHFPIPLDMAIGSYNIGLTGMYGMPLGISANYIFLFIIFGTILRVSGAIDFFTQLALLLGRRFRCGAGMVAVISSSLVGSLTGQGSANVAITGPFSIPIMKRAGYNSEQAAAIETVSSTGGQLVPPVMGITAFLMAEYIGVPYIQVCGMAIMPAILYYFCVAVFVQLNAVKRKVSPLSGKVDYKLMAKTVHLFIIPLAFLIGLLVAGYTLMFASFVVPIVVFLLSLIRKETRGSFKSWVQVIADGAVTGAKIAASSCMVGIIVASIDLTAIGILFPSMVERLSGGSLVVALLLVALATMILGCGIPPFASYLTVAMLCAPVLIKLGVPLIPTHFFLFIYAVVALITPPVALSAVVAAPLADASYIKTAIESVKAGAIGWLLPFLIIWIPGLVLQPQEPLEMAIKVIGSLLVIVLLQVVIIGYYLMELNIGERIMAGLSVIPLIASIAKGNYTLLVIGLMLGSLLTILQYRKRRLIQAAAKISIIENS